MNILIDNYKVEKTMEKLIKSLKTNEIDRLIENLVQYKEGNVTVKTLNSIKACINRLS